MAARKPMPYSADQLSAVFKSPPDPRGVAMYNDVVPLGYIGDILLRETYHSDKIGEPAPREEDCYSRLTVISPRVQYESINPNGEVVLLTRCYVWILLRRRWVLWMAVYNDSDKPMPVHYADAPPVAPGCITFLYLVDSPGQNKRLPRDIHNELFQWAPPMPNSSALDHYLAVHSTAESRRESTGAAGAAAAASAAASADDGATLASIVQGQAVFEDE